MRLKSRIPRGLDRDVSKEHYRYLESLDRRIPARDDLAGGSTTAQVVTAFNTLLEDLREQGLMER